MLALVNTPSAPTPVTLREVAEPEPAPDESLLEVHAFSFLAGAEVTGVVSRPERAVGLTERGATAVVTNIREAQGEFHLILESAGGSSLAGAISKVAPGGAIVVFGNSSREETSISFSNFAGHARAHLIAFFIYESGTPASMGEDLSILVSLVAAEKLVPEIGLEESWHQLYQATTALRNRNV